jgi:hypothetical protein
MSSQITNFLTTLKNNDKTVKEIYLSAYKTMTLFPPKLNGNKFIYGKVIEHKIINTLGKIFPYCVDLDNQCQSGSSYKNDCNICISKDIVLPFSIKVCKNPSEITIINKNNAKSHDYVSDVKSMNFIVLCIQRKRMYVFKHTDDLNAYLVNTGSNVHYKASLLTYLNKLGLYYDFQLSEEDEQKLVEYSGLDEVQIYEYIYKTFIHEE